MGDSWLVTQQPANMDGVVHITNIAIFHQALADGDFPVRWTGSFANYGLPMGSFAQQFTSYLGAIITFVTQSVVVSYTIVLWMGTFFSLYFFYLFLKEYYSEIAALSGAVLFNFSSFRILNGHIRGALPEFFSSVFVALLLLGLVQLVSKGKSRGFFICTIATWGLLLTHPMNVVTSLVLVVPFTLWLFWGIGKKEGWQMLIRRLGVLMGALLLGLSLSAYYVLPLLRDIRFFFYGLSANHFNPNQELTFINFLDPNWYYFDVATNNILSRGHIIRVGLLETLLLCVGFVAIAVRTIKNRRITLDLLFVGVVTAALCIFLITGYSTFLYQHISLLSNIQFPWRMLSSLIFIAPIVVAYVVDSWKKPVLLLAVVVIVLAVRSPQLYGKNYTNFDQDYYYTTIDNLHTSNMNTIWTEETKSYPVSTEKVAILDGSGVLSEVEIRNSRRTFVVDAETELFMIDKTFYFPGWEVYVDRNSVPIEFQDINHRGVITYRVPAGHHNVVVQFKNTTTVGYANMISLLSWIALGILVFFREKLESLAQLNRR